MDTLSIAEVTGIVGGIVGIVGLGAMLRHQIRQNGKNVGELMGSILALREESARNSNEIIRLSNKVDAISTDTFVTKNNQQWVLRELDKANGSVGFIKDFVREQVLQNAGDTPQEALSPAQRLLLAEALKGESGDAKIGE